MAEKNKNPRYSYRMGMPEVKYGNSGYCYEITDSMADQVISCWAVGSEIQVENTAINYVDTMNELHDARSQKLKGIERA